MIIVMQHDAAADDIDRVTALIRSKGLSEHVSKGKECTIIGAVGDERVFDAAEFERLPKVARAIRIVDDWRLVSREVWQHDSVITVRGIRFGGAALCAREIGLYDAAETGDAAVLLDPFYAPANPYSGEKTRAVSEQELAQAIAKQQGERRAVMVRVRDSVHIDTALCAGADILYLGGEWLENPHILHKVGQLNVPVVLCKHRHHQVDDWLRAAEQIALNGNPHIILGEAGTLSLNSSHLRLDVDALARAKKISHLPVLAHISHLPNPHMDKDTLFKLAQAAGADVVIC